MDNKELYTIKEVADLLRVGTPTVKRYIKEGKIKAVHLSSHVIRILRSEIAYLLPKSDYPGAKAFLETASKFPKGDGIMVWGRTPKKRKPKEADEQN